MDERYKEPDKKFLLGLFHTPPHRKAHSYSNLRTTNGGSHPKRHQNQLRKHSLDETHVFNSSSSSSGNNDDALHRTSSSASDGCGGGSDQQGGDGALEDDIQISPQTMPEFLGNGGGVGVFKVPNRAAVPPSWPPCLELRPHPLRETQAGKFIRTIASTETQLWAGQESGVRVWNYSDAYEPGIGMGNGKRNRRGDEDAAPFHESAHTSPTICMMVDQGSKLIWTGHKDGRIRSWKVEQQFSDAVAFKEGFSWLAHRTPVLSMAISFYGDIWSGSENGAIRVWPWETVEKSLSLSTEERHMAALLVERSVIDLKAQVTVNGVCSISASDVKCLLSDNVRAKIWGVGSLSFSLWNARTRDLLKVFNIEGQLENRVDMSSSQDQVVEDEMNVKFVTKSKKDKSQGFLQRSRNAIMGAADAVRRAAKGAGAFVEDTKKTVLEFVNPNAVEIKILGIIKQVLSEFQLRSAFDSDLRFKRKKNQIPLSLPIDDDDKKVFQNLPASLLSDLLPRIPRGIPLR